MDKRKDELMSIKARELMRMATKLGIKGAWDMKKAEVVEAILRAENAECSNECGENAKQSAKANAKVDDHCNNAAAGAKTENEPAGVDMSNKMPYIETADVGTLVAFRLSSGKVKSAKIIKKSSKNRRFLVETDYGAQYIVQYDDVIWVRTGKRWPKGVYMLLKGMVGNEKAI